MSEKPTRILYVEDHEQTREATSMALEMDGMDVVAVESGEKALEDIRKAKAEGKPFDVILSDNTLSENTSLLNGVRLLATPDAREIPVRWLHTSETLPTELLDKGVQYTRKDDVSNFDLIDQIKEALEGAHHAAESGFADKKPRILYAEDTEMLRNEFTRRLTKAGFEVDAVENGQQALERLQAGGQYDILLTDNRMPRLTGMELLETEEAQQVPARLLHSSDLLNEQDVMALGATLVCKPCESKVLVEAVSEAYKRSLGTAVTAAEVEKKAPSLPDRPL